MEFDSMTETLLHK